MRIELAFEHALNGHAVLFIGSGCSIDATNLKGERFKSGNQLASHLSKLASIDDTSSLSIAAEEYELKYGKDRLIEELQKEFTVKTVHESHLQIAQIPWRKIYTTNYDNVMEIAYAKVGKKLLPVTTDQNIRKTPKNSTLCIHLNGFIDQLRRDSLETEFKLTDSSYIAASLSDSPWAGQFRDDIRIAKATFFIGYSLYDLDVQRLLFSSADLKDKCFFIVGINPTQTTEIRARKFGDLRRISTKEFAEQLDKFRQKYVPPQKLEFFGECIREYKLPITQKTPQDKDIFDLVLYGKYQPVIISSSISSGIPYYLERDEIEKMFAFIDNGERTVVVHSELGNGKTLLIEGVKMSEQDKEDTMFIMCLIELASCFTKLIQLSSHQTK